ncbi:MAG: hypothetical protein H6600_02155 [Flavobacteriales bacterium]|nr:hypothetical protein [Flavobacteriales bacterium]MCB9197234.1 hypothetical protein [Flavobacteriales bacterium]
MDFWAEYGEIIKFASIPVISAVIGWGTNVLALKMTFFPLEFIGIKPFLGWQGIIPSKAEKMSKLSVDLWTTRLVDVKELFAQIDPAQVADEMRPQFDRISKEIMDEFMEQQMGDIWSRIPESVKKVAYARISRDMPGVVKDIMTDVKENIEDVFDIKAMVVQRLVQDKSLLNEIFLKCGKEEFKFIERSGFYFGFLFGLLQMGVWFFYQEWWILPVAGLIVGYATNWLALKLIFQPIEPVKILGMKIQGLFITRQNEVSEEYAKMLATEIFTFDRIFAAIVNGPTKQRFVDLISHHAKNAIDEGVGISKPVIKFIAGERNYDKMKSIAVEKTIKELPKSVRPVFPYAEEAMDLETVFRTKMQALSPPDFVDFLRPVFQEDELKLILVGAVLGMAAGVAQLVFVFGGLG